MDKKGQAFRNYTEEFKIKAVRAYLEVSSSDKRITEQLDIRNCSQLKALKNWKCTWMNG
ncbi:hypothetical protein [Paenibacillus sp. FJAT-27812]|uniref:hypothetical protein n=1 Tax=Paenibacillus sp. FJAT-27812 TaxID=1684143 RepID=UPI000A873806|nr:hypothetical protein [Paenibacillus sp. FJAT-27812]